VKNSPARLEASAWLRKNPGQVFSSDHIDFLSSLRPPPILDQARDVIRAIGATTTHPGQSVDLNLSEWRALSRAADRETVNGMSKLLQELGWVSLTGSTLGQSGHELVQIAAGGLQILAEDETPKTEGDQGFVAMSFDDTLVAAYRDGISPALNDIGYRAHRVDDREYEGRIDDEIRHQIEASRFVVADLTMHRGGVYYEAGVAHGLGIPVFFTCRKDDFDDRHFDITQYNTIDWETPDELREKLCKRIKERLGVGPRAHT
jgi:nucleoside 2-deoxyribosyltransferase